jgi:prevent-host-death family protein
MEMTMSAFEARRQFGKLLEDVAGRGDTVIVERHGEPVAAVIPIARYRQMCAERDEARERLFTSITEAAQSANLSTEEAEALALEEVFAARAERALEREGFFTMLYQATDQSLPAHESDALVDDAVAILRAYMQRRVRAYSR